MCYECEKTDHFIKNYYDESVMSRRQLNVTLKRIFETEDTKNILNKVRILKINSNDEYCVINSKTKLQKIIERASNNTT